MIVPSLESVKRIEQQFRTGEEPVVVMCTDLHRYVCKYMRSSASAYKLACEFIGATMAKLWQIKTPEIALVKIKALHWEGINISHCVSAPSIGNRWLNTVIDVTPTSYLSIPSKERQLNQLMKIALFDFWVANEDRNANNSNLMYDLVEEQLVSIDYGCIFNTATFDYPLSQLTSTDTILWSDLFQHLAKEQGKDLIISQAHRLKNYYENCLSKCLLQINQITAALPNEWNLKQETANEKMNQLFDKQWTEGVWNNFIQCLNENIA